jgi:hypothetical protein
VALLGQLADAVAQLWVAAELVEAATGRAVWPPVVCPPAQAMVTVTRSLVPVTVMVTWSTSARMICLRSASVVVGAVHRPGMSLARR